MTARSTRKSPKVTKKNWKARRLAHKSQELLTLEIFVKLGAQIFLSLAAISAIVKLLPYQQVQQAKLEEIQMATQEKETRVNQLREEFTRNFDPNQSKQVMQEQTSRRDPNQRPIFLTAP
ncbi:MAG: hypothetical protein N5P05_002963 [Chroococcopsis gigantea SAG 12.99]|jgi:predicted Co/Zn/Cd cation transporter (cation efflux family)|nr:hypothetical protein [Chlorogloea purpurea SAG 13.99]MDV3001357.1 hypothetical protein [Chroococcopsis gigantea SAG 12.99]